ncbi:hypothetical protein AVEN_272930-1, partial [Araneus ventricosus]
NYVKSNLNLAVSHFPLNGQVVYLGPCPSGMVQGTWSTTYVVDKCDVMWKLPHPVLTGGSERQLRKLTFGIDLSNYNVG